MKKIFNTAARVALGLSMAALALVYAGNELKIHRITSADPVGRVLTTGEVSMARDIFGDTIDYSRVRIHKAPAMGDMAVTKGSDIYMEFTSLQGPDLSAAGPGTGKMLAHELTHVWQNQKPFSGKKAWLALRTVPGHLLYVFTDSARVYKYDISSNKNFTQLNQEQQAAMVETFYDATANLRLPLCRQAEAAQAHTLVCDGSKARVKTLLPRLRPALPVPGAPDGPG